MTSLIMHFVDYMQRHAHYLCLYKQKRTSACVIKWKWLSFLKCMSLIFHTSNGIHFKDLNWQFHFYIKWHFNLWKVVHAHFCNWSIVDLHINNIFTQNNDFRSTSRDLRLTFHSFNSRWSLKRLPRHELVIWIRKSIWYHRI